MAKLRRVLKVVDFYNFYNKVSPSMTAVSKLCKNQMSRATVHRKMKKARELGLLSLAVTQHGHEWTITPSGKEWLSAWNEFDV